VVFLARGLLIFPNMYPEISWGFASFPEVLTNLSKSRKISVDFFITETELIVTTDISFAEYQ